MSYLSSNQLKQYMDEGFVSPINIFSKEKAKEIRNEIELIEKKIPGELDESGRYNAHLISPLLDEVTHNSKILELEKSLQKPLFLMKNKDLPFFDTSISNKTVLTHSISLINIKSIEDFQNKTNQKIEAQRFRGNIYVNGVDAWEERNWIGKIIKINNISFKVEKNIPRCVAINLKPNTDDNSLNLLKSLKKTFNHFDMGIYLTALDDGRVYINDKIIVK